jgi:hypothetical protein
MAFPLHLTRKRVARLPSRALPARESSRVIWQWICSQLTLTHDALVRLIDALYLIFKFTVMLWQSLDHDISFARHVQGNRAYKKQPLANLEFVLGHNGLPPHKEITHRDRARCLDA